ncbi:MAG: glycosyltransferase [Acidobacteriota bacterium]
MSDAMAPVDFSIVLPSYREEENLRLLLPRIQAAIKDADGSNEIVIVDTVAPLDKTELICSQSGVRYVRRGPTNSFGDAVRTGIREARGRWIVFMDADGSHGPEWIPRLLAERQAAEVVIASRYVDGGSTENPLMLRAMSRALNVTYSLILGLNVQDVSNSFKLYRAELLKELSLTCQNFDIIEEILFKIRRRHPQAVMKEIPFPFKARLFGHTKRNLFLFMVTYLCTILRLRFFAR